MYQYIKLLCIFWLFKTESIALFNCNLCKYTKLCRDSKQMLPVMFSVASLLRAYKISLLNLLHRFDIVHTIRTVFIIQTIFKRSIENKSLFICKYCCLFLTTLLYILVKMLCIRLYIPIIKLKMYMAKQTYTRFIVPDFTNILSKAFAPHCFRMTTSRNEDVFLYKAWKGGYIMVTHIFFNLIFSVFDKITRLHPYLQTALLQYILISITEVKIYFSVQPIMHYQYVQS